MIIDLRIHPIPLHAKTQLLINCTRTYDLNNIRLSGALYIRKVARVIDPNMYSILPVDLPNLIPPISWPSDVKISPVPDWEKTLAQYRKQAATEKKESK